jgi:hypothetical protein
VIGTKKVMIDGVEYDCQIVSPIDLNKKQKCRCKGTRSLNAKQIKIPVL